MFTKSRARRHSTRPSLRFVSALLVGTAAATLAVPAAHAQQSQATLRGTVTGGATQVTAVEIATGIRRTVEVGASGTYNFASLRPGVYRLEVVANGTTRQTEPFTLNVAQNAQFDFDAGGGGAAPQAEPTAEQTNTGEVIEPSSAEEVIVVGTRIQTLDGGTVGTTISQRLIEQLPQNNRNFLAFAELAPGVQFIQEGTSGQARIQGGAQASSTVNVFIDGISQKDFVLKNGITGQDSTPGNPFPQLAIGEYRVLSSNYKAEFDQVSSVAITATTKSGTNEFHGEGFFDYTDETLRDFRPDELASETKTSTRQMQFGGALGGPIVRDVAHFFVSYEGKRLENPVSIAPNNVEVGSLPTEYQDLFGGYTSVFNENLYFGKIDLIPTSRDLFEVSVKYRDETGPSIGSGNATFSTRTETEVDELRVAGRWEHTGEGFVNEVRVEYQDASWSPQPSVFEPGRSFQANIRTTNANGTIGNSGYEIFRTGGSSNFQDKGQKGWLVQDDFTYTALENHTFKVGAKARFVKLNTLQQNLFNPLYTYDTNLFGQNSFNDDIPYRVQFGAPSGPGNSVVESDNFQFGIYAQDDWDVNDRLTLNIGLRWDYERTPAYHDFVTPQVNIDAVTGAGYPNLQNANYDINDFITDGDDRDVFLGAFQPRLGFTYRFDDEGRFAVFGGYGRSYDRTQFDYLQQEVSVGAYQTRTFNFIGNNTRPGEACTPSPTCIPFDPIYLTPEGLAQLAASSAGGGRELRFLNNDLKVPYSDQFSLGFRTRFSPVELEVGYSHVESHDGFAYLLGNRRPDGSFFFDNPASATDTPGSPFTFTPPGFGSILIGTNGLESSADTAYFKFSKPYRVSSPWSLDATYTFTEAEENRTFGEYFSLDYPSIADYPTLRSSGVPRHRLVMAGSADTPIGLTLSGRFTIQSPQYLKAFLGSAVPFERNVVGAFAESLGDQWGRRQFDIAATKYFGVPFLTDEARIRVRVDIINLFNDRNYINFNNNPIDNTRTSPTDTIYRERVGRAVGGNPPRTIKLSAGFTF